MLSFFTMFILSLNLFSISLAKSNLTEASQKKKIVIFICNGGYGHRSACAAIKPMLEQEYELAIVNPFTEIIQKLDYAKKITGKDCDEVYNILLRKGWTHFINFYTKHIVPHNITGNVKKMTHLFDKFIKENKPDMILSLIPVINLAASNAAAQNNIPYMIVTLDHNTTLWQVGMQKCQHPNIVTTVHNNTVKKNFCKKTPTIPAHQIISTGFPVRQEFTETKNVEAIKKEWNIPSNKKIIMLMIGSVGGNKTLQYVKELSKSTENIHVLTCIGSNTSIDKKIQPIIEKSKIATFSLIPFTHKIADLMAVSDLIITKPGPGIIEESLQMNVPLLLDVSSTTLFWERENVSFAVNNKFAQKIKRVKQINRLLTHYLDDKNYQDIKNRITAYQSDFPQKLQSLIHKLCPA